MLEAALFQLRAALDAASEDATAAQMRLGADILAAALRGEINAARVSDIDFAVADLVAMADGLSADVADAIAEPLRLMREDVLRLREATALAPQLITAIGAFRAKLKARRAAIERATYRETDAPAEPLPHAPADLHADALPLRDQLAAAGFATPALDAFIADRDSLRFHTLRDMDDELEVIAG